MPARQLHLGAFMRPASLHTGAWRYPGAWPDMNFNFAHIRQSIQTLEKAKFDAFFMADHMAVLNMPMDALKRSHTATSFEPFTLLSALSQATERIGLVATASTTFDAPYHIARRFASLDHISNGRAGWNIVTSGYKDDALHFSRTEHVPHGLRYERAEEFVDIVRGLWDSYDDDAFPRDKQQGLYVDPQKMHELNHKGRFFQVKGPTNVQRSPQGHPVLIQAGSSDPGKNLFARVADIAFTSQSGLKTAQQFYADIKGRCEKFGRAPEDLKVMPGALLFIGDTESEAKEKYEELLSLVPLQVAMQRLEINLGGFDLSGYDLDGPVPDIPGNTARVSASASYVTIARREGLTIRQLAMRAAVAKHHWSIVGSTKQIADQFEEWFTQGAADGFNVLPSDSPGAINALVDKLVPELQRRGLFRTEYEGATLRDHLGLARPPDRATRAKMKAQAAE